MGTNTTSNNAHPPTDTNSPSSVQKLSGAALHLVSKWAGHSDLTTTLKYLHVNESYEYLEMDKMLETEKANEKIVSLDEYRKAS